MLTLKGAMTFPHYSGIRCLMMPYIQGDPNSIPDEYGPYKHAVEALYLQKGEIGFLTIDESPVNKGNPHRGQHAKHGRALHTEAGLSLGLYEWQPTWGGRYNVTLDRNVKVLLANNLEGSCALWDAQHFDTTDDGDIGHLAADYPYEDSILIKVGEVYEIGIFTPHESVPVQQDCNRQFFRIVGSGVHGREQYFTQNPKVPIH